MELPTSNIYFANTVLQAWHLMTVSRARLPLYTYNCQLLVLITHSDMIHKLEI